MATAHEGTEGAQTETDPGKHQQTQISTILGISRSTLKICDVVHHLLRRLFLPFEKDLSHFLYLEALEIKQRLELLEGAIAKGSPKELVAAGLDETSVAKLQKSEKEIEGLDKTVQEVTSN